MQQCSGRRKHLPLAAVNVTAALQAKVWLRLELLWTSCSYNFKDHARLPLLSRMRKTCPPKITAKPTFLLPTTNNRTRSAVGLSDSAGVAWRKYQVIRTYRSKQGKHSTLLLCVQAAFPNRSRGVFLGLSDWHFGLCRFRVALFWKKSLSVDCAPAPGTQKQHEHLQSFSHPRTPKPYTPKQRSPYILIDPHSLMKGHGGHSCSRASRKASPSR